MKVLLILSLIAILYSAYLSKNKVYIQSCKEKYDSQRGKKSKRGSSKIRSSRTKRSKRRIKRKKRRR